MKFAGAALLALGLLLGAYSNSFQNEFHFDDSHVVTGNIYVRSLANVPQFFLDASTFSAFPTNATYRPIVTTSLALDYWLAGGLEVWQFHLSQLVMLITLGIMLFYFYKAILDRVERRPSNDYAALTMAAVFCLHTTATETMNLIHARSELLSAMGVIGSFLLYQHVEWSRRTYLYLAPMVLGALAKSPAVMFAPLLFVYLLLFEHSVSLGDLTSRSGRAALASVMRQTLPALATGIVVFLAVESQNAPAASYGGGSRWHYLLTQTFAWLHYGRLFVFPIGLSADTDWKLLTLWYDTRVIAGILFIGLLLYLLWVCSRTAETRPVTFGLAWFMLALLPASSVFPLAEVVNEHRVFFPYIGLSLATIWGVALLARRWAGSRAGLRRLPVPALVVASLAVLTAFAVGTYERNKVWRTGETLWRDVTEKSPENGRGLMNYGLTQMSQGKYVEAKALFDRALVYTPNYPTLEINLGIVTDRLGDAGTAERHFARALDLQPDYPAAHVFYARWLNERGRHLEAIPHLRRALELSPAETEARSLLLDAYAKVGDSASVERLARETLQLSPGDARAQQYLHQRDGLTRLGGEAPQAVDESVAGLLNESLRLYQAADYAGSIEAAKKALTLDPSSAEAYNNVAAASASLGRWDNAIAAAREALRLKPDLELARNNLAWAEAEKAKASSGP